MILHQLRDNSTKSSEAIGNNLIHKNETVPLLIRTVMM